MTGPGTGSLPLDGGRLAELLSQFAVNDRGERLVDEIRSGQPARSVQGAGGNVTGRHPSRKMGRTVAFESRTCEYPYVMQCETDDNVWEFWPQPTVLTLHYPGKGERRVTVAHTPDFLVLATDFVGFVECKPDATLERLTDRRPGRYVRDGDGFRSPPAEAAAAQYGLGYRCWTPRDVSPALTDNCRLLEAEWGQSSRTFPDEVLDRVQAHVRSTPAATLEELVNATGDPDPVHWAIFHQRVYVDLAAAFLSHPDRVRVFPDRGTAVIWQTAMESVSEPGIDARDILSKSVLAKYPPEAVRVAHERFLMIRDAIEQGVPASKVPGTRGTWVKRYRKAQRRHGIGLVGLCPNTHLQGNRIPRFPLETRELMEKVAREEYEDARNATVTSVYATFRSRCIKAGLPFPGYSAYARFLRSRDQLRTLARRRGRKQAAAAAPNFASGDPSVVGQGPLDTVHIDHVRLDLPVLYGMGGHKLCDYTWLTASHCAWSSCVPGLDLSFEPPSVASVYAVLQDIWNNHGRFPNRIVVDRGAEFGSRAVEQTCAAFSILKIDRPPSRPRFGAVMERWFHTLNTQVLHNLRGNSQLLKDARSLSPEVAPERFATWRLPELDAAIRRFAFEVYPEMPHRGLDGMTPNERFRYGLEMFGRGRVIPDSPDLRFLLWPPYRRDTAMVNPRTGITVEYITYWHDDMLADDVRGTRVPVRVDPFDCGHVAAFIRGRWVLCRSERPADFEGLSRRELRLMTRILRRQRQAGAARRPIRTALLAQMIRELRSTEDGLLRHQRERNRQAACRNRGMNILHPEGHDGGGPAAGDGGDVFNFDGLEKGTRL